MRRIASLILTLAAVLSLLGCGEEGVRFTHCEMTLNLPDTFFEVASGEYFVIENCDGEQIAFSAEGAIGTDLSVCNGLVAITLLRLSHEAAAGEGVPPMLTQLDFARFYLTLIEREAEIKLHSGVPYFTYESIGSGGESFTFLLSFFQTPHAYFVLSFITTTDNFEALLPDVLTYIGCVSFS